MRDYFYDMSHMNANGAKQNAYALVPAILSLLPITANEVRN